MQEFEQHWGVVLNSAQQSKQPLKLDSHDWPAQQWGLVTTRAIAPGDALVTAPRQAVLHTETPRQLVTQIALLAMPHTDSILDPVSAQKIRASHVHMNTDQLASNPLLSSGCVSQLLAEQAQQEPEQRQGTETHKQHSTTTRGTETVKPQDDYETPAEAQQSEVRNSTESGVGTPHGNSNSAEDTQQNQLLAGLVRTWVSTGRLPLAWTAQLALANLCRGHPQHTAAQAECNSMSGEPRDPCRSTAHQHAMIDLVSKSAMMYHRSEGVTVRQPALITTKPKHWAHIT